jgi:hypothetical protein
MACRQARTAREPLVGGEGIRFHFWSNVDTLTTGEDQRSTVIVAFPFPPGLLSRVGVEMRG